MNYLLKSKPKRENKNKYISIVILFFLLSFFSFFFFDFFHRLTFLVAKPLWNTSTLVSRPFVNIKYFFVSKNSLISKNLELEDKLTSLNLKEIDYDSLLKENQYLKSELGRVDLSSKIVGRVLSRPPISPYDVLVLDVGSSHGVVLGSKVYISDSVVIGKISNVGPDSSLVEIFSTGNKKEEAVLSRTGTSFTLVGQGGANFKLEVPKDTDILWGDTFIYPGLKSRVLGSVYYIDSASQSSFKTVYIKIPGNVFSSQFVFIDKIDY